MESFSFQWSGIHFLLLASTWAKTSFRQIKSFSVACCNRPSSARRPDISARRQTDRQMELCWCVWLPSSTCYWAVSSSWFNKADCRPSLLPSMADQWESLLTGASLCSMISNCVVSDGAFMCIHMWEGRSGGCECVLVCIYLPLYGARVDIKVVYLLPLYLFACRPQRRIDSWATRWLFVETLQIHFCNRKQGKKREHVRTVYCTFLSHHVFYLTLPRPQRVADHCAEIWG